METSTNAGLWCEAREARGANGEGRHARVDKPNERRDAEMTGRMARRRRRVHQREVGTAEREGSAVAGARGSVRPTRAHGTAAVAAPTEHAVVDGTNRSGDPELKIPEFLRGILRIVVRVVVSTPESSFRG